MANQKVIFRLILSDQCAQLGSFSDTHAVTIYDSPSMKLGICAPLEKAADVKAAGADFIEVMVQPLTQPTVADDQWKGVESVKASPLPVLAANVLLPGTLRVTGPDVNHAQQREYLDRVMSRAGRCGLKTIVFGSGVARKIPEGFSVPIAWQQVINFAKIAAEAAGKNGITVVAEPLNRGESNVLNSVGESGRLVEAVGHPNFQLLVDSYHFWLEEDSLEDLKRLMPMIKHVHVADKVGRVYPGESGVADYRPFFAVIKAGGYDGPISVEATSGDVSVVGKRSLDYLRSQWKAA
jgi:D-psicose/D-tagatose/L-ribulose 3-epimerase